MITHVHNTKRMHVNDTNISRLLNLSHISFNKTEHKPKKQNQVKKTKTITNGRTNLTNC